MTKYSNKRLLQVGIIGAVSAALCCFTPILAVLLGIVGLGTITGYLDYVLLPALFIFFIIIAYALLKEKKNPGQCSSSSGDNK